ncbi:MAG TPA: hydrogenase maturation nickel metallochaperone HypA [Burkholderiaceae bacterium]|nr:hydrogenase maturation nickel metallochaperone HypA [Burkholderiaceae bacterium]
MHELSLAGGILRVVEEAAQRERFVRVKRLTLAVGTLAGIEVDALRFALDAIAPGTVLAGADVVVESEAGTAWCLACQASVAIEARAEPCPACGSGWLQATGGTELRVKDLVVEDACADPALQLG